MLKMDDESLVNVMIEPGKSYDFKVGKRFIVMTGAWGNRLFFAQSYDRKFGKKYGHNFARYTSF